MSQKYGEAPPIIITPDESTPKVIVTEETLLEKVYEMSPTDDQFQGHILAYLRDDHGLEFDRKLNPHAAQPRYLGKRITLPKGQEAYEYTPSPRGRRD